MKDQLELIIKIANHMDLLHQHQIADHMDEIAHHTLDLSEEKFHSYMAKPQLAQIAEMAEELYNSIPDGATLPDWAESKSLLWQIIYKVYIEK